MKMNQSEILMGNLARKCVLRASYSLGFCKRYHAVLLLAAISLLGEAFKTSLNVPKIRDRESQGKSGGLSKGMEHEGVNNAGRS